MKRDYFLYSILSLSCFQPARQIVAFGESTSRKTLENKQRGGAVFAPLNTACVN
ncbi:MAG: hypothetical protein ABIT05_13130 [Chitinophagaceae bacterium]